ncbi:MAG: hypothetical protein DHS80DRAFT_20748 [Piptocephalis tieghemiana]|nr:MAG: hypothetical protein DHS80DRAFT_20748 [Piptocephalis tieghemiana]
MHPPDTPTTLARLAFRSEAREERTVGGSRSTLGFICLTICVVAFTIQSEGARVLQGSLDFPKPYFILFLSHSLHFILLPIQLIYEKLTKGNLEDYYASALRTLPFLVGQTPVELESSSSSQTSARAHFLRLFLLLVRRVTMIATMLNVMAYFWYVGAAHTTPARLTAAYNTAAGFTYVFAVLLLNERQTLLKTLGVVLGIMGVAVTALASSPHDTGETPEVGDGGSSTPPPNWKGDAAGLLSAVMMGYYEVIYKRDFVVEDGGEGRGPHEGKARSGAGSTGGGHPSVAMANTVTGAMGIANILILWVPFPLLHLTGLESFSLPDLTTFGSILFVGLLGVVYNSLFMVSVALVGPVVAAVGVMCTIPLVTLVDWVGFGIRLNFGGFIGCTMVCVAFVLLTRATSSEEQEEQEETREMEEALRREEERIMSGGGDFILNDLSSSEEDEEGTKVGDLGHSSGSFAPSHTAKRSR